MEDRHAAKARGLEEAVLNGPGELAPGVRKAIVEERHGEAPPALRSWLEKVAHRAWTVTDEDVEALKQAGLSEDQIFEATTAAAVGAGLKRLRAGLAALGE
jgi:alkylhydroperoxidase family enzyme